MSDVLAPLSDKYEIVDLIREGGMGSIYRVRHRLLDEVRVVKVLRPELVKNAALQKLFIEEARAAIRLRHPNVVHIFDFLLEGGVGYLVTEHIDGVDLGELVSGHRLPSLPLALEIADQSLRALGYLHRQGYVHRDVAPDNLMLSRDVEGRPLVKVLDLGIAERLDRESVPAASTRSSGYFFVGKPRYASPEHLSSRSPVEARSDLYSFGVVLYELVTGRYPIAGTSDSEVVAGHLHQPPLGFDETDPGGRVPPDLRRILRRVLEKDPGRRFASAAEMSEALSELQAQFPTGDAVVEEVTRLLARDDSPPPPLARTPSAAPDPAMDNFDHHLQAGCLLAEEESHADAVVHFEAALELQPENEMVRMLLAEVREKLDRERRRSHARLEEEVRQLRRLLEIGRIEAARVRLLSARRAYGDDELLDDLERRLETVAAATHRGTVGDHVVEAGERRRQGDFLGALRLLEKARQALADQTAAGSEELRRRIEREEEALQEAHRRAAEVDEGLYVVLGRQRRGEDVEEVLAALAEKSGMTSEELHQRLAELAVEAR